MVRLAQSGEVVGRIVRPVVIQVSNRQTGRDLQTAHRATLERVVLIQDPARIGLLPEVRCYRVIGRVCQIYNSLRRARTQIERLSLGLGNAYQGWTQAAFAYGIA